MWLKFGTRWVRYRYLGGAQIKLFYFLFIKLAPPKKIVAQSSWFWRLVTLGTHRPLPPPPLGQILGACMVGGKLAGEFLHKSK